MIKVFEREGYLNLKEGEYEMRTGCVGKMPDFISHTGEIIEGKKFEWKFEPMLLVIVSDQYFSHGNGD